ncbi:MAG: hypothetical protein WC607_05095 [Candidatus Micrarchaeia archaeon]
MDMLEFTKRKTGMDDEYKKVLNSMIYRINTNGKTKESLENRKKELDKTKRRILTELQYNMTELSLEERALAEISENWNNKAYWGDTEL